MGKRDGQQCEFGKQAVGKSSQLPLASGKATIAFGTAAKPGPVVEVSDSLAVIFAELEKEWKNGHWLAVIETPAFRLIVDEPCAKMDGTILLRPAQR